MTVTIGVILSAAALVLICTAGAVYGYWAGNYDAYAGYHDFRRPWRALTAIAILGLGMAIAGGWLLAS